MQIKQSSRLKTLMQSEIRNMSVECDAVGGINLAQGICDFPLQSSLLDGASLAMKDGENHYTRHDGIDALRKAVSRKALSFNKLSTDSDKNISVSCGATGALYSACFALLDPGDEVILFEPFYGYHEYTLHALNLEPVYVRLSPPDWSFDIDELEKITTPKTKAILINTPSNPCGKVFSLENLNVLADFAVRHDLIVLTDEIYEYITYSNISHISPGTIPAIKDRTVTISGFSKTFSITGWRIGYALAPEQMTRLIGYASDLIYVCAPAPLQYGVAQAIDTLPDTFYADLATSFQSKRDQLCGVLTDIGLIPYIPQGAYYVLAEISRLRGNNSKERAMWLLEKTGVAAVPGDSFYHSEGGKHLARFCFARSQEIIDLACEKLNNLKGRLL